MSQKYDNRGQISLWLNEKYEVGGKYPKYKGSVILMDGSSREVALWENDSDNPKAPALKGKHEEKKERAEDAPETLDDEIPF